MDIPTKQLLLSTARPDCGLWSMFFQVIGHIRYAEAHDMEVEAWFDETICWWEKDGYNNSHNGWQYFFEQLYKLPTDGRPLPQYITRNDYILPHVGKYDHTEAQRQEYAAIVKRRIKVRKCVLDKMYTQELWYNITQVYNNVVAIHYRGTDKYLESPRQPLAEYSKAIAKINPTYKLFVATDDADFLNWMIAEYKDRVLYTNCNRSKNYIPLHKGPYKGAKQAEECLIDVLLMAQCAHLIHGNSSVSNGVLVFNPTMSHDALHMDSVPYKPIHL